MRGKGDLSFHYRSKKTGRKLVSSTGVLLEGKFENAYDASRKKHTSESRA